MTEDGPDGYAATPSADCDGTIAIGQTKTCTITNDDIAPKLKVIKHVDQRQRRDEAASDFSMHVKSGGTDVSRQPAGGPESPAPTYTLDPGTYNGQRGGRRRLLRRRYSGDCDARQRTLALAGETKTCTITNNDIAPKLTVIKHVINDNGGRRSAGDFTMTVNDPGTDPPSFPGAESPGTEVTVDAGSYSVSEGGGVRLRRAYSADCSGTLALGADQDLHGHEQRHPAEAGREEAGRQQQRRHQAAFRLHDDRDRQ